MDAARTGPCGHPDRKSLTRLWRNPRTISLQFLRDAPEIRPRAILRNTRSSSEASIHPRVTAGGETRRPDSRRRDSPPAAGRALRESRRPLRVPASRRSPTREWERGEILVVVQHRLAKESLPYLDVADQGVQHRLVLARAIRDGRAEVLPPVTAVRRLGQVERREWRYFAAVLDSMARVGATSTFSNAASRSMAATPLASFIRSFLRVLRAETGGLAGPTEDFRVDLRHCWILSRVGCSQTDAGRSQAGRRQVSHGSWDKRHSGVAPTFEQAVM